MTEKTFLNIKISWFENWFWSTIRFFKELPFNIKQKSQKLIRGYSDVDIWGLDTTITEFILSRLIIFRKKKKYSVPCSLEPEDCDIPENVCLNKTHATYKDIQKASEEWDKILDKMIWAFKYKKYSDDMDYPEFCCWNKNYGLNKEKYQKLKEKESEGLRLFIKYYDNLWD